MKACTITRRSTKHSYKPWMLALACALGLSISTSDAQAQVRMGVGVDRPAEELIVGKTVYTQDQGTMQAIVGGSHMRSGDLRNSSLSIRGEYGLTDRLQLQAEVPLDITDRSSGFEAQSGINRIEAGATFMVTEQRAPVALSAAADIEMPLGSQDVTGDRPSAGPIFKPALMAATGSGAMTVHASTQAELGQESRSLNYSVGSMYELGKVVPSLEMNARSTEDQRSQFYATPGVTYKFSESAQLGVGAAIGLNEQSRTQLLAKFSIQLGR